MINWLQFKVLQYYDGGQFVDGDFTGNQAESVKNHPPTGRLLENLPTWHVNLDAALVISLIDWYLQKKKHFIYMTTIGVIDRLRPHTMQEQTVARAWN